MNIVCFNFQPEAPSAVIQNTLTVTSDGVSTELSPLHVTGSSYPGVPLVMVSGRTDNISWSLTPANTDTADLFVEDIRMEHDEGGEVSYSYLHSQTVSTHDSSDLEAKDDDKRDENSSSDDVWKPAKLRREIITVRPTKRQTSPTEITLDCLETERGVVLPAGDFAVLRSTGSTPTKQHIALSSVDRNHPMKLSQWFQLNAAQNWGDFNEALEGMHALSWNALYADTSNNIGGRVTGR